MFSKKWRVCLSVILILQLLHLPMPCPDLDGECRGAPIASLMDGSAWHCLITGVNPNGDIDLGPILPGDSPERSPLSDSPYGDLTLSSTAGFSGFELGKVDAVDCVSQTRALLDSKKVPQRNGPSFCHWRPSGGRILRTLICVWCI